ncbi:MAG: T9SS type A sorting domain-containing protein, partial [Bacteroidetes bacterium]|nr:T9SS type A sorting domain-containing protein [Bacteroidota bacterium]
WKDPITDPTFSDVEFNDAFAVTYVQPRIQLPRLINSKGLDANLYPNPASKGEGIRVVIHSSWNGEAEVQIRDAVGRLVNNESLTLHPMISQGQPFEWSMGTYSPGTYTCQIRVKTTNGEILNRTLPFVIKN